MGDRRSCGSVEQSIQTIKRKLGTEKLDPSFKNLKSTLQQIVDDIRKTKHATFKKNLRLSYIMGESLIRNSQKHVIMLFIHLLHRKDWKETT